MKRAASMSVVVDYRRYVGATPADRDATDAQQKRVATPTAVQGTSVPSSWGAVTAQFTQTTEVRRISGATPETNSKSVSALSPAYRDPEVTLAAIYAERGIDIASADPQIQSRVKWLLQSYRAYHLVTAEADTFNAGTTIFTISYEQLAGWLESDRSAWAAVVGNARQQIVVAIYQSGSAIAAELRLLEGVSTRPSPAPDPRSTGPT